MSPSRTLSLTGRRRQLAAGQHIAGLFEEHGRMVYGVCRLLLRDSVEAEDASQQTFLSAYRGLLAGQEPREPAAWLGTIARNECRSRMRSRRDEPLMLVTEASSDDVQREVGGREEINVLCSALAELPPQQRDAIVLREFYGLSYAEVAAALGLSGPAVESLLFRSRKRLQDQLRPVRAALGVLTLPLSLRESLAQAMPGFGGAGASAGAGAAVLAKVGSAPIAAKIAAATLALGTAGTIAGVETHAVKQHHAPARAKQAAVVRDFTAAPLAPAGVRLGNAGFVSSSGSTEPSQDHRSGGSGGASSSGTREHSGTDSGGTQKQEADHSGPSGPRGGSQQDRIKPPQPDQNGNGSGGSGDGSGLAKGNGSGDGIAISGSGSHDSHGGSGGGDLPPPPGD